MPPRQGTCYTLARNSDTSPQLRHNQGGCHARSNPPRSAALPSPRGRRSGAGANAIGGNQRDDRRLEWAPRTRRDGDADQQGDQCGPGRTDQRDWPVRDLRHPSRNLRLESRTGRLPNHRSAGSRRAGGQCEPDRPHDGCGRRRRDHDRRRSVAIDPDPERRHQHGHRKSRDRRAAAQRAQLSAAGVADSGRHHQRAFVEPGQTAHGRPAQQLCAERGRPAHPLQPLLARRRREHRPELQLLHAAAVGRRAGGVQRHLGDLRCGVRPRHRPGERVDQVGFESTARHGVRVPAQLQPRCEELLRQGERSHPAIQAQPVRVHAERPGGRAEGDRWPRPIVLHGQLGRPA